MGLDHQRKRIEFHCAPEAFFRFAHVSPQSEEDSLHMGCFSEAGVKFERAVERRLSGFPVPIVYVANPAERQVRMSATLIEGYRKLSGLPRPPIFGAAGISPRIGRIV